jgi:Ca2+-binding EF-hand superfamily protein
MSSYPAQNVTTVSNATFRNLDNNNDGYIYRNEWRDTDQAFNNKDCNRDGKVSQVEYFTQSCSTGTCDVDCLFRELDVNNDGVIYRTEWRGNAQTFNQLDQNRDDTLTRNEFTYINQNQQGKTQRVLSTVSEVINSIFRQ